MSDGSFPDALILAALARAERHCNHADGAGVLYATVVDHLGLEKGSATGRRLRPRVRALEAGGFIASTRRHGLTLYAATPEGRRILADKGEVVLPESPRHRDWREARSAATDRIRALRANMSGLIGEGAALLADDATDSEAWFTLGERLASATERLASATYCLREWAEPNDDASGVDDGPRCGWRILRPGSR